MKKIPLSIPIRDKCLFNCFFSRHEKLVEYLSPYKSTYEALISRVIEINKELRRFEVSEKSGKGFLLDINLSNGVSIYRENIFSIYENDTLVVFKIGDEFAMMPSEKGFSYYEWFPSDIPLSLVISKYSDFLKGRDIYKDLELFLLDILSRGSELKKIKEDVYKEIKEIKTIYQLLKTFPFLIDFFPESYFKKEILWMKENFCMFPYFEEDEFALFEMIYNSGS